MDIIDNQMDKEIREIKEKYSLIMSSEIKSIREKYKIMKDSLKESKRPRKSIPKSLKDAVWDRYIGKQYGIGTCYCCGTEIDSKKFDCGHIISVAKGGLNVIDNLKPVCATCNKSMGTQNLEDFKKEYFPRKRTEISVIPRIISSKCFCGRDKLFWQESCYNCTNFVN